jgi:hypothetical protein
MGDRPVSNRDDFTEKTKRALAMRAGWHCSFTRCGKLMPDRAAAKCTTHQVIAPGDDVRPRHGAEFFRPGDAGEAHKVPDRGPVSASRARVAKIGEPFDLGRHIGELVKLGGGEQPRNTGGRHFGWTLVGGHERGRFRVAGPGHLASARLSAAAMFRWPVRCAQSSTERISSSAVMRSGSL